MSNLLHPIPVSPRQRWTAEQVLNWVEQFRQMMLAAHSEAGVDPTQVYDKIRAADPSRRVAPSSLPRP